jgi:ubiquinone/menaquinone biosynthesis C-methylase UbiE
MIRPKHNAQVVLNHQRLARRDALMRRFGYDAAAGIKFVLSQTLPLGRSVLEIGTGKGRFLVALAPHVSAITTADISADEQRCARLNARYAGVKTKITYVIQDAARLPWPDHTFDAVVTMNAIHHISRFHQVLQEMQRVVKPNGKLVLSDLSPRGFQIMARLHRSEGKIHERHRYDFRAFRQLLHNQGWTAQLRKGQLQEVLVAQRAEGGAAAARKADAS